MRTYLVNAVDLELAVAVAAPDLTIEVVDATAAPQTPFYLVVQPFEDAAREYMLCTDVTGNVLTVTRGLAGSQGDTHPIGSVVRITYMAQHLDDLWLRELNSISDVTADAPTNRQILSWSDTANAWIPRAEAAGGGYFQFEYRWAVNDSTPASGRVSTDNNADPTLVTTVYLHKLDANGDDLSLFFEAIDAGDWLNIGEDQDITLNQRYDATGQAVLNGDVWEVPVVHFDGINIFSNNEQVRVFYRNVEPPVTVSHDELTGVTSDQHHAQVHAIDGPDHTGTLDGLYLRLDGSSVMAGDINVGGNDVINVNELKAPAGVSIAMLDDNGVNAFIARSVGVDGNRRIIAPNNQIALLVDAATLDLRDPATGTSIAQVTSGQFRQPALRESDGTFILRPDAVNAGDRVLYKGNGTDFAWWWQENNQQHQFYTAGGNVALRLVANTVRIPNGSGASPGLSFQSDSDLGLYRVGTDKLGFSTGNFLAMDVDATRLWLNVFLRAPDGAKGSPGISFNASSGTGLFLRNTGPSEMGLAAGGVEVVWLSSSGTNGQMYVKPLITQTTGLNANVEGLAATGQLVRVTSALKYKKNVRAVPELKDIELRPVRYQKRAPDNRTAYGFIADDLAAQDELLGVYAVDEEEVGTTGPGELEDYQTRGVMAVMAAKINDLTERISALEGA